jgi:small basic protein
VDWLGFCKIGVDVELPDLKIILLNLRIFSGIAIFRRNFCNALNLPFRFLVWRLVGRKFIGA